jgi:hypothetical protein
VIMCITCCIVVPIVICCCIKPKKRPFSNGRVINNGQVMNNNNQQVYSLNQNQNQPDFNIQNNVNYPTNSYPVNNNAYAPPPYSTLNQNQFTADNLKPMPTINNNNNNNNNSNNNFNDGPFLSKTRQSPLIPNESETVQLDSIHDRPMPTLPNSIL